MRLLDLEPSFRRITGKGRHERVKKIANADGVMFLCPKCFAANGGSVGTHGVICWGPDVSRKVRPGPGRWTLDGSSLRNLTLNGAHGKSRSVLLLGGCAWHGYVTNGEVTEA